MQKVHLYLGDLFDIWPRIRQAYDSIDLLLFDAPYSATTCNGHNDGMGPLEDRGLIEYPAWGVDDVQRFCQVVVPCCRGWTVSITDDVLGPWWRHHYAKTAGLYAFSYVPAIAPSSRFRAQRDGPASVSYLIYAARPREQKYIGGWCPSSYYFCSPPERHGKPVTERIRGEKSIDLLYQLVRDYVRGQEKWVLDPCCGRGSTLIGAWKRGQNAIGIERDPGTFKLLQNHLTEHGITYDVRTP